MARIPKIILPATHSGQTQQRPAQITDPRIFHRPCIVSPHNIPALFDFLEQKGNASFVYYLKTGVTAAADVETGHTELAMAAFQVASITEELKAFVLGGILSGSWISESRFRLEAELRSGTFKLLRDTSPMESSLALHLRTGGYEVFGNFSHPDNDPSCFVVDIDVPFGD